MDKLIVALMELFSGGVEASQRVELGGQRKRLYDANAKLTEMAAQDALDRGLADEDRHRLNVRGLIGRQRAALAAQGIEVNDGSALAVVESTAYQGAIDATTIRNNAQREAWGFQVEAFNLREQGKLAEKSGENEAFSTILTAGARAYGAYRGI